MPTLTQTESTPGEAEGQAPGGWQGEGLAGFPTGISTVVNVSTIARRIYVDGTDSEGNAFPDGTARAYVGETPNVIGELTASQGNLQLLTSPTVQIIGIDDIAAPGFDAPQNVNAADVGSQTTVRALAQLDLSAFVAGLYRVFLTMQVANDNGQIETHVLMLLLTVRDMTAALAQTGSTLPLFTP